jgi:hypothetical protein
MKIVAAVALMASIVGLGLGRAEPQTAKPKPASAEEIQKLIQQLGHDSFAVREEATKRLAEIGRPAVPALREALRNKDAEVRQRAQRILEGILTSVEFAIDGLKDKDATARKEAAETLERLGPAAKEALPALLEALKDPNEDVREAVVLAILSIDPDHKAVADMAPKKASVDGKYRKLLKRIKVEVDKQGYTEYRDYGLWTGNAYAGYNNLPQGYWVYVYPYWYIWGEVKGQ